MWDSTCALPSLPKLHTCGSTSGNTTLTSAIVHPRATVLARVVNSYGVLPEKHLASTVAGPMNIVLAYVPFDVHCAMAAACRSLCAMVEHDATVALPRANAELREALRLCNRIPLPPTENAFMSRRRKLIQTRLRACCIDSLRRWSMEREEVQRGRTQSATVAVCDRDMDRLRRVLRLGANLSAANYANKTAMITAWDIYDLHMIRWLHLAGVQLPPFLPAPGTPGGSIYADLWSACLMDSVVAARCLLEANAASARTDIFPHLSIDPVANMHEMRKPKQPGDGRPPLHFARSTAMVRLLLAHGADLDAVDVRGNTAVHSMCSNRSVLGVVPIDVLRLLVSVGADFSIPNKHGQTCLHAAAAIGNLDTIRFLLSLQHAKGIDIDARDALGRTPLLVALSSKDEDNMMGAMSHCSLSDRDTAEVVRLLVEEGGAQVNVRDDAGKTPLGEARFIRDAKAVVLLSAHGAKELDGLSKQLWEVEGRELTRSPGSPVVTLPRLQAASAARSYKSM